jgi:hypothetical protein
MDRNIALLENKMTIEWQRTLNGSSHSSLQARGWSSVGSHLATSFRAGTKALKPKFIAKVAVAMAVAIPLGYWLSKSLKSAYSHDGKMNTNTLRYRMGKKVLTDDVNVYCKNKVLTVVIWYGNWEKSYAGIETMEYLAGHIGDSNWYSPMRDYYFQKSRRSPKDYVKGAVHFKRSYYDSYSSGSLLDPFKVTQIIKHQLNGSLPDPNGLYFVIGSSDVKETASWGNACGYHSYTNDLASYPTYYSYLLVIFIIFYL